jgi:hypothetical protein
MRSASAWLFPITLIAPLASCAAATDYPSLQRRPAERMTGTAPPVAAQTPAAPPAPPGRELTARLAQLVEQARSAHQRFSGKRANAERLVAAGGGTTPGSEGWSVATVALSDLESARSQAMLALADLDQLFTTETIAGNQTKVAVIADAREQVTALVGEEDEVLARLRSRMGG